MMLNMMMSLLYSNGLLRHLISRLWDVLGEHLTKICAGFFPNAMLKVSHKELRQFLRQKGLFTSKGATDVVVGKQQPRAPFQSAF